MRAVFVRHIKPAPSGSSSKKKKPYYLTDAMQFTIPYVKALNNTISGNLPLAADREVTEQEDNEEANESQMSQSILQQNIALPPQNMPSSSEDTPSPMSCPLPESSPISNQPLSPMSCPPSRSFASSTDIGSNRRKRKPDTVDDGIMEYFKARKANLEKKSEHEDPKRMFLLSLLPDMKAMSESQTRTFKRRVLALVDDILEESPRTLAPPQRATPAYNFETQTVFLSTPVLNEPQATPAVTNEQQATPAYDNHILTYYESAPLLINTNNDCAQSNTN